MPGKATRRMLQRSIIQPITGTITELTMPPTERANEAVPRCQPISAMIGFRNTPKVNASTGPLQTKRPVTAPPTTHHGLLNLMPKMPSHGSAGLCRPGCRPSYRVALIRANGQNSHPLAGPDPATHVFLFLG